MAKRFTDSEKWRDRWVRRLSKDAKLLWFYLCDACDHAGFWERDEELLEFQLGGPIDFEACLAELGGRVLASPDGRVLFLTKFIVFQYGELSPDCRPHKRILETIAHWEEKGYPIGYSKGIYTFKDKEKDKDRTKTKNEGGSGETSPEFGLEGETVVAPVMVFPCAGREKEWHLMPQKLAEWEDCFPAADVRKECRVALQWLRDNPSEQKTARGMSRFLGSWLKRGTDRRTIAKRDAINGAQVKEKAESVWEIRQRLDTCREQIKRYQDRKYAEHVELSTILSQEEWQDYTRLWKLRKALESKLTEEPQ